MADLINASLPDHEQLVSCPLNKAHMVVKHRMPNHIIKCSRSHSRIGTKECRFNTSHVFAPNAIEEHQEHEKICPDRLQVEMSMMQDKIMLQRETDSGISSVLSVNQQDPRQDEDWDTADPVPTYNPLKTVRERVIIRNIQHGTPALRKELREKEHARIMQIQGISSLPKPPTASK